ncbi:EamA family transporter [Desulfonema ishimotonii]|uniref:EamA family transporter n=1 Tax=Desulfonema ishimotonii TaxID=45657 RepID=A0A401G0J6_9BACT|nr:DMT family transporter [Desulfonema ishimotonii]GBC62716.1 EamA family transporter [Desulfonema ishimotonii]
MTLKGYGFILAAAGLWGLIGPISKFAFQEGVTPLEVAFWRAILAWALFAAHAVLRRQVRMARRDIPVALLFGITGVTCFYGFYLLSIQGGGAALAAVLLYTAPAWVAVLSRFFLKETLTPVKLTALFLTLTGVTTVSLSGAGGNLSLGLRPVIFGLLSGFCYALYYIFGKYFSSCK